MPKKRAKKRIPIQAADADRRQRTIAKNERLFLEAMRTAPARKVVLRGEALEDYRFLLELIGPYLPRLRHAANEARKKGMRWTSRLGDPTATQEEMLTRYGAEALWHPRFWLETYYAASKVEHPLTTEWGDRPDPSFDDEKIDSAGRDRAARELKRTFSGLIQRSKLKKPRSRQSLMIAQEYEALIAEKVYWKNVATQLGEKHGKTWQAIVAIAQKVRRWKGESKLKSRSRGPSL